MSENLWRPRLESYLAVREAMGHSVRAERKLLGEFLDFVDQKGGAGPIRAEWALDSNTAGLTGDLFLLILHELYHVILGHTRLFPRVAPIDNIVFDAVVNSMLSRTLGRTVGTFFVILWIKPLGIDFYEGESSGG